MIFREFDSAQENPQPLWALHETVYPGSRGLRERWTWEVERYPRAPVRIYVAENYGRLIGMTMRTPVRIRGKKFDVPACFATNSMVHPEFRGQGIIKKLYARAADSSELQLSKGTAPAMYRQLMSMGYRAIEPSQFLICLVAPAPWIHWKLTGKVRPAGATRLPITDFSDFNEIQGDSDYVDDFSSSYFASVMQNEAYFNWRYFLNPLRRYQVYLRKVNGVVVSRLVMRLEGHTAYLVDLRWNVSCADEPRRSIRFMKVEAKQKGAIKIVAWATLGLLRSTLKKERFMTRRESPHFSYLSNDERWRDFPWDKAHFVHGDSDTDYL